MASETIQPTTIQNLQSMLHKAYAFLAGAQLDVFTALADGPLTVEEVARAIGCEPRRLSGLLSYLVPAGLLTVADGRFANTPEADRFLVRGRPGSLLGGTAITADIWAAEARTAESIRAGHAAADHNYATLPRHELVDIYCSLDPGARAKGEWLASTFDFGDCQTLVDVGGGSGGLAAALTAALPHVQATVVDLPSVIPVTEEFLTEAGAADRVQTLPVDLRSDNLPDCYDAATLSHFAQLFEVEEVGPLLARIGAAVRPGGMLYVLGFILDDTRLGPEGGLWFNFAAISIYERGAAYTESQYRAWLRGAGFGEIEVRWATPVGDVIIARKRG
jgi:hypothetical protein